jgi:hypothetical protein
MWNQKEEWDNIQKGWLNSGQEQRYYANSGAGIIGAVILVLVVYVISKFF